MTHLEFHCSDEKATALLKAARLYDEGVELQPVRHGEWVGGELGYCTCCGHEGCASDIWNGVDGDGFCPNCGAEMRGGTNE